MSFSLLPANDHQSVEGHRTFHQAGVSAPQAKLVVTFFANSSILLAIHEPLFTTILTAILSPEPLTLHASESLTSRVIQLTYLTSSSNLNPRTLRHDPAISAFEKAWSLEMIFDQLPDPTDSSHRPIKLAIFDMDSTLIEEEVIDELARSIGVTPAVSAITARAMNGELDFEQSLRERLALLEGVHTDVWGQLQQSITIAPGARELCKELRRRGVIMAVASGGFAPMAEWLKEQLGLDYAFANHVRRSIYIHTTHAPPPINYP